MNIDYFCVSSGMLFVDEETERDGKKQTTKRMVQTGNAYLFLRPEGISTSIHRGMGSFAIQPAEEITYVRLCIEANFPTGDRNLKIDALARAAIEILEKRPHEIHPDLRFESQEALWVAPANYEGEKYYYCVLRGGQPVTKQGMVPADFPELIAIAQRAVDWLVAKDKEIYALDARSNLGLP